MRVWDAAEFGYRFLADEPARAGVQLGERRAWRLCARNGCGRQPAATAAAAGKTPGLAVHDGLIQRVFTAPAPDLVWLADISRSWSSPAR
jgi:hypothetical protein